jgi:hypothetical protein
MVFRVVDLSFGEDINPSEGVRERGAVPICHRSEPVSWSPAGRYSVDGGALKKRDIATSPGNTRSVSGVRVSS